MNKAVMISIRPQWCELIASGKKTVEVRKTRPKLETPFKCYIYCTKGTYSVVSNGKWTRPKTVYGVIGEFVCDSIIQIQYNKDGYGLDDAAIDGIIAKSCMQEKELYHYLQGEKPYLWHISDLVIYDEPKELGEFKTFCKDYYDGDHCEECKYFIDGRGYEYDESDCGCNGLKPITRPPQSWCYMEEFT